MSLQKAANSVYAKKFNSHSIYTIERVCTVVNSSNLICSRFPTRNYVADSAARKSLT